MVAGKKVIGRYYNIFIMHEEFYCYCPVCGELIGICYVINDHLYCPDCGWSGAAYESKYTKYEYPEEVPTIGNIIGFYHEDDELGCLSNWYAAEFDYAGRHFFNSEQFMMYHKVLMFGRKDLAEQIMNTKSPAVCKKIAGQRFPEFIPRLWDDTCYAIVKRGVRAKFIQNPDILWVLLVTENALLAECSAKDKKWGIGIDIKDPAVNDVSKWTGQNLLGRILMEVRTELRQEKAVKGKLEYVDAHDLGPIPEWKMKPGELMRVPQFYSTIHAYGDTLGTHKIKDMFYNECTLAGLEMSMRINQGGGFPWVGFWELKQDVYDIARRL